MNIDRAVLAFAGSLILISTALSQIWSSSWLWLTAWVAVMMLQSAFTGFCPAALLFKRLGAKPGSAFR